MIIKVITKENIIIDVEKIEFTQKKYKWKDECYDIVLINSKYVLNKRKDWIEIKCDNCGNVERKHFTEENCSICSKCLNKKTKFDRYGDENYTNNKKYKQTCLEKYGVENVYQLESIKKKVKETNLKKYGLISYTGTKKYKESLKNNYGIENVYQLQSVKEKKKKIYLEKYGVENISQSENNKEKVRKRHFESMYFKLINSNRLKELIQPLFTLNDYQGVDKKYQWKCCKCSYSFESNIDNGIIPRCPICFPFNTTSSKMEKELVNWIKSLNIIVEENNRTLIHKELDIYIPSHNLAIEFDGLYWHSELQGKNSKYHLNKTKSCQEKGIQLLHVFEDEWIEKQDIVKSIIKNKLSLYDQVIYGRKCIVKNISSKEANEFYDQNHIQGSCNSKINLGLFYEEELVSALSFSNPRYNKKYNWEITRFANKLNTKIHGSFGKLWKNKLSGSIITYSDKRLFTGSIYQKYMTQLQDSGPAYWYVKNGIRYNRVEFQKHKLHKKLEQFDINLTEWENMQLNGYDRIWDCGNWIFEFK